MDTPGPGLAAGFGKIRVLLVEDETVDATLAEANLRRSALDVELRCVGSEDELRRGIREFDPHLVVSDFTLRGFDGYAALAVTREMAPALPFIFLSDNARVEGSLGQGATDFVRKTDLSRLVPTIERALREKAVIDAKHLMESELGESRRRLSDILDATREWIWEIDSAGRFTFSNRFAQDSLGYSPEEILGRDHLELVHPDDRDAVAQRWAGIAAGYAPDSGLVARWLGRDGGIRWLDCRAVTVRDAGCAIRGFRGAARDVTLGQQHEEKIARLTRVNELLSRFNTAIGRIDNGPSLLRESCRLAVEYGGYQFAVVFMIVPGTSSVSASAWWGIDDVAVRARQYQFSGDPPLAGGVLIAQAMQSGSAVASTEGEAAFHPAILPQESAARGIRSVAALPLSVDGTSVGLLTLHAREANAFDAEVLVSLQKIAAEMSFALQYLRHEDMLQRMSYFDALTGLANRALWCERLARRIQSAESTNSQIALVAFDLDGLSVINDGCGRDVGDRLLQRVAENLRGAAGSSERIAYLGSGVFSAFFEGTAQLQDLTETCRTRVESLLEEPLVVEGREVRVSARIGAARYPDDGRDPQTLLQNAEIALRRAKYGGDRFVRYSPRLSTDAAARLALEAQLRQSVKEESFELHYQPIVDAATGRITAVESLLRWRHPAEGLVSAGQIIPMLESLGLIEQVGAWVLRRAAADRRAWLERGLPAMRVAVNVSAAQLRRADFVETVLGALDGARPAQVWLDLEVTESMLMHDIDASMHKLGQLRSHGVRIAIDDFGTGYSSLNRLARLPITTLKIDRSFVHGVEVDRRSVAIVETILSLSRSLGLRTIAEGIETDRQRALLASMGCDELQGYLFSQPLPPAECADLVLKYRRPNRRASAGRPKVPACKAGGRRKSRSPSLSP